MLSPGERGTLLLVFYLLIEKGDTPLIIDQPEGNLDNHTVAKVLVECIKEARNRRQVFIVTHNPNLAVVCDADQVIHASMDKASGNTITYTTGALENPAMSLYITDVLEGTRWAFGVRDAKYRVAD
jgi:ABC-type lipoprotein export system ATPase subunit